MIPYYLFIIIPLFFIFDWKENYNKIFFNAYCFLLVFFIGFRFEVGGDWDNYYRLYLYIIDNNFIDIFYLNKEPGFVLINYIIRYLNLGFVSTNLFAASIFIYGLYSICIRQKYPWIGITVSLPYFIFVFAMGATKQSIATGFILLAFTYLSDKKNLNFVIIVLIASLFHYTAIFILFFIFANLKLNKKNLIFIGLLSSIIFLFFTPIILRQYLPYFTQNIRQTTAAGVYFRMAPLLICAIVYIYLYRNKIFKFEDNKIWLLMSFIIIIFSILSYNFSAAIDRFSYYFFVLQIIVLSRSVELIVNIKDNLIFKLLIYVYSILLFFLWFTFSNHYYMHVPYKLFLM